MRGWWAGFVRRKPLQQRATLLFCVVVAAAILLANLAGYVALRVTLVHTSQTLALSIAEDLVAPAASAITESGQLNDQIRQAGGVVVVALASDGSVLRVPGEATVLVLQPGDRRATHPGAHPVRRTGVDTRGVPYVVVATPVESTGYALVVARPLQPVLDLLRVERVIVSCVILASLLAAGVAGGFLARYAVRPVRQLTAAVQHVSDTRDFQPLGIRFAFGDLALLASSFNQLLRMVAAMRERQSRLVADAGHELRTPLTSLTTNVELLSEDLHANHLSVTQKGQVLGDVRAQLAELTDLVANLVHLARDDAAGAFRPVDLREVVRAATDRVRRRGPNRVFDVALEEFHVVGDADGLERMVTNLLDNAVKWSPPGSTIRVRLRGNRLSVADSGPGIAEADLPFVFDRFFRGTSARKTPGTGLGLSIVAKTVKDHGGLVSAARSADGGAEFTVQLPGVTHRDALPGLLIPTG